MKFCIVIANYYPKISKDLMIGASRELKKHGFKNHIKILVPGIFEIEKLTGQFVKDIYLMVETPQSETIKLSVMKSNEGNKIVKQDAMYLIQDAKQQLLKSNLDIFNKLVYYNLIFSYINYRSSTLNPKIF